MDKILLILLIPILVSGQDSNKVSYSSYVFTKTMLHGDYRFSSQSDAPSSLANLPSELQLIAFPDSIQNSFLSESEIWRRKNCPSVNT